MSGLNYNNKDSMKDSSFDSSIIPKEIENLEKYVDRRKKFFFAMFFALGLINNSGYVLVSSASQDIADHFEMQSFMSVFPLSLILFSSVMIIINSKYLIRIPHIKRILFMCVGSSIGFAIISFSTTINHMWGFYLAIFGSVVCGIMQSLGECVMIGFL